MVDRAHPSTAFFTSDTWAWKDDEFYFMKNVPAGRHILAGRRPGQPQAARATSPRCWPPDPNPYPLTWCRAFEGGRTWYTALGHKPEHYSDATFRQHLLGGIQWAMGRARCPRRRRDAQARLYQTRRCETPRRPNMKNIPFTRRQFIGPPPPPPGALAFPTIIPSSVLGADAPSKRLQIGAIGCGRIAREADIPGTLNAGGQYVAVCDVDSKRAAEGKAFIEKWCADRKRPTGDIDLYGDYREMLKRKDIDAVTVSTPDHWHAKPVVDAVRAGKHIYVQKPAGRLYHEGLGHGEGRPENPKAVIQFGTQQRSQTSSAPPANWCATAAWAR
jgi:hypothetical protein